MQQSDTDYDFKRIAHDLSKSPAANEFAVDVASSEKKHHYALGMFPYPSGNAHLGHVRVYTIVDIHARFHRHKGQSVLNPLGWDSFGLPAENAAIKNKVAPDLWTNKNIKIMRDEQFAEMGWSFDMTKELNTSSPDYYRWTQWIFLQFLKHGKAYRAKGMVNWCPEDETVLANEQVIDGRCWRDGAIVEKRPMEQWFLRITDYAERLWNDIELLKNWAPEAVAVQKNWINRSFGTKIEFNCPELKSKVGVFTTRADTLFGVVALVLAPEHPLVEAILSIRSNTQLKTYVEEALKKSSVDRVASKDKTGVATGIHCVHPLTGKEVPLWVGDYVLGDYGTGAVMCVPAHDERDYEFAKKFALPTIGVVRPQEGTSDLSLKAFTEDGILFNSPGFDNLSSADARDKITSEVERRKVGEKMVTFNLRDWSVGRQRYWGCPIPVIYCDSCGVVPVPEDQLPVLLPKNVSFSEGKADIKSNTEFINTKCPKCAKPSRRETDTLDTFVCSSWYAFRFIDPNNANKIFESSLVNNWMPINFYVGGLEHAALHMIYFRFFTKFFKDIGLVNFDEPVDHFFCNGMVIKDGSKMSKSKGNVVVPTEIIETHGSDVLRFYIMSDTPANLELDWDDSGLNAKLSFLKRTYRAIALFLESNKGLVTSGGRVEDFPDSKALHSFYSALALMEQNLEGNLFHNAVARLHELTNFLTPSLSQNSLTEGQKKAVLLVLRDYLVAAGLFVPYFAESLYQMAFGNQTKLSQERWPIISPELLDSGTVSIVVQVNGKKRGLLTLPKDVSESEVQKAAQADPLVATHLEGKTIRKVIYVPQKILNIVI